MSIKEKMERHHKRKEKSRKHQLHEGQNFQAASFRMAEHQAKQRVKNIAYSWFTRKIWEAEQKGQSLDEFDLWEYWLDNEQDDLPEAALGSIWQNDEFADEFVRAVQDYPRNKQENKIPPAFPQTNFNEVSINSDDGNEDE